MVSGTSGHNAPVPRSAHARELPPDRQSVSAARTFVGSTLERWDREDLAEAAVLLTSELVTNAVLHAGTDVRLVVELTGSSIRVEVHDHSKVLPALKHYATDATTGRGLELVETIADAWGVDHNDEKCVWFELRADAASALSAPMEVDLSTWPDVEDDVTSQAPLADIVEVRLVNLPLGLYQRAVEARDELIREFELIAHTPQDHHSRIPARLLALTERINDRIRTFTAPATVEIQDAIAAGQQSIDITYTVPPETAELAAEMRDILDEADGYCRAGAMIALAAPGDVVAFRHWLFDEFVCQIGGHAPRPWPLDLSRQGGRPH